MGRRQASGYGAGKGRDVPRQAVSIAVRSRARDHRQPLVYTRKSSEEGLEQDFNSLHAQREACEAFIASQQGEG